MTSDLSVIYWVFVKPEDDEEVNITPVNDNDFDDFGADPWDFKARLQAHDPEPVDEDAEVREDPFENGCVKEAEIPAPYNKGNSVSLSGRQCALRFQIVNSSEVGTY